MTAGDDRRGPPAGGGRATLSAILAAQRSEAERLAEELAAGGAVRRAFLPSLRRFLRLYLSGDFRRGFPGLIDSVAGAITLFAARARAREIIMTKTVNNSLDGGAGTVHGSEELSRRGGRR